MTLDNESDVEQKIIWALLTDPAPEGLGYSVPDIKTKPNIRQFSIGKGDAKKLHYPDYVVIVAGLPALIVEAKKPGESIENALYEGRLYANEINALYPHGVNPCSRVLACNGDTIAWTRHDQSNSEGEIPIAAIDSSDDSFAKLVDSFSRTSTQEDAEIIRRSLTSDETYRKPVSLVGGASFQDGRLAQNTFGATIAGDYGRIFNPNSPKDRKLIAEKAYIPSVARSRLIEPIDRMIRNAVAPSVRNIGVIKDSSNPTEVTSKFEKPKNLEDQLILLIGSVGAGKSTFVDYFSLVALPEEIRQQTVWLRINLNDAPLDPKSAYTWIYDSIISGLKTEFSELNFNELDFLNKVYSRDLKDFKQGPVSMLDPESEAYKLKIVDHLNAQISDKGTHARALATYFTTAANKLFVIALDNCDKRNSEEQLTIFQIAHWMQSEFRCLTLLPLRDVTYELHRNSPPLDTALKQYVFRIEPPAFSDVLQARVKLALDEMSTKQRGSDKFSYKLPNGMLVTYDAKDQSIYLASMLRSLYAHDRLVRQIITGLAGRDVRRALEIFLDFCKSGHIGEDEIFEIRRNQGNYVLSLEVVTRVLLRVNHKYYSGENSYLKNLIQADPEDAFPDHFVRISILRWFDAQKKVRGPAGVEGFHSVQEAISCLSAHGHDAIRVNREIEYLVRENCLLAEHLRPDNIDESDLVKISSSGIVHLQLLANPEYVAACAEDTYMNDESTYSNIAALIVDEAHYSKETTAKIVEYTLSYLQSQEESNFLPNTKFINDPKTEYLQRRIIEIEAARESVYTTVSKKIFVRNIDFQAKHAELQKYFEDLGLTNFKFNLPDAQDGKVNRGFGFLTLTSDTDLQKAITMDLPKFRGREVHLKFEEKSESEHNTNDRSMAPSLNVYVGNVPLEFDEQKLRALLADSNVTAKNIKVIKKAHVNRVFAFLEFSKFDDASAAIGALHGMRVEEKILRAAPAKPSNKT